MMRFVKIEFFKIFDSDFMKKKLNGKFLKNFKKTTKILVCCKHKKCEISDGLTTITRNYNVSFGQHCKQVCFNLHLKIKKLSTNSLRDFNSVLDIINHYWIDPAEYICPNSSSLSSIYNSSKSNVFKRVKSKNRHTFL